MKLYEQIESLLSAANERSNHGDAREANELRQTARKLALGGFREMQTREMVAYWNTLQFPGLIVDSVGVRELHISCLSQLLLEQGIKTVRGKRLVAA